MATGGDNNTKHKSLHTLYYLPPVVTVYYSTTTTTVAVGGRDPLGVQ